MDNHSIFIGRVLLHVFGTFRVTIWMVSTGKVAYMSPSQRKDGSSLIYKELLTSNLHSKTMKPQTQLTRHASPGSKHVSKSKPSSCSSTFSHLGQRIIKASTWLFLCLSHHGGQISIVDQPCLPTTIGQRLTTHPSCNNNMLTHHFYISYCVDSIQNFKKF